MVNGQYPVCTYGYDQYGQYGCITQGPPPPPKAGDINGDYSWRIQKCAKLTNCMPTKTRMSSSDRDTLRANDKILENASKQLSDAFDKDVKKAAQDNLSNAISWAKKAVEEDSKIAKKWGCDATCVDTCATNW